MTAWPEPLLLFVRRCCAADCGRVGCGATAALQHYGRPEAFGSFLLAGQLHDRFLPDWPVELTGIHSTCRIQVFDAYN